MNGYREFDHIELGATLYTPATNKNISAIANGEKFEFLRSVVFCLEDAIKEDDVPFAMKNIQNMLESYKRADTKVFIRARDLDNLQDIVKLKGIEKIDGFSIAKFGTGNMREYFDIFNSLDRKYHIMPVIESKDMFDIDKLKEIREFLQTVDKHNIVTLRVGGEDMFKMIGIKRECGDLIHDFHIASKIFGDLLSLFKPYGFNIAAPVYNCLENMEIFKKEVLRDIKEGFFGKTVIHPDQAKVCNECFKVSAKEYEEAKQILDSEDGIFRFEDKMCEPAAHNVWAGSVLKRAVFYGKRL